MESSGKSRLDRRAQGVGGGGPRTGISVGLIVAEVQSLDSKKHGHPLRSDNGYAMGLSRSHQWPEIRSSYKGRGSRQICQRHGGVIVPFIVGGGRVAPGKTGAP